MNTFVKLTALPLQYSEKLQWLLQNHLCLAVFVECARRVWRKKGVNPFCPELRQGEFVISQTEYEKFGLKKSTKSKLFRAINALVLREFFHKTGKKTRKANSNIYKWNDLEVIDPTWNITVSQTDTPTNTPEDIRTNTREDSPALQTEKEKKERKEEKDIYTTASQSEGIRNQELPEAIEILDTAIEEVFTEKKVWTKKAKQKLTTRLTEFTVTEIAAAFRNLLNEPDTWKLQNNGFRPLTWWLHSQERILEMQSCHRKQPAKSTPGLAIIHSHTS